MNSIVHFELPVAGEEAKKFYADIFGWKLTEVPNMSYTMVYTSEVDDKYMPKTPGAVNGGMMSVADNGGTNPVLVIDVPNLDEYIKKVTDAGATIVQEKAKVGEMGWYARFKDPSGVIMGIWETIPGAH